MAKTPGFYGPAFEEHYRFAAAGYFLSFAQAFWPLLLLVAMRLRARGARAIAADLGERALTLASAIFVAYHLTTVVPIMGMASRFFFPCLPALAVLAVRTIPWVDGKLQERLEWLRDPIARTRVGLAIAGLIALTSAAHGVDSAAVLIRTLGRPEFARFTPDEHYAAARHTWVGLDELRILPDNLVLASTEIGLPGVLLPRKAIVDLAGLQEPLLTRDGMPAPEVIRRRRPDWVYLPHPHYRELAATIFNDDDFRQNYEVFSSEHFGAFMGVAIRRESRYYEEMLRIARSHEVPDALWIRSGPMRLHGR
ncbi:MAG: hypothetical protein HYV63_20505 [Candidatus Schekmanbacteria bacterium]|nr:hypothetical protein [Candidatus Schekmanbacteria bacterium]